MDLFSKKQKIALYLQREACIVEMVCVIERVEDDRLIINLPQYFMRYIDVLQVGNNISVKAFSKFGTIDFNSIIITSPLEEEFSIELDYNAIKLTPGEKIPGINAMENLEIKTKKGKLKVQTFEIATNYLKFSSPEELKLGDIYDFTIFLPAEYGIINFKGLITEIDPIYDNEYTTVYETMTEVDKQTLLYYIYVYNEDDN